MTTEQLKKACERLIKENTNKELKPLDQDALALAHYVLKMFKTVMGGSPLKS